MSTVIKLDTLNSVSIQRVNELIKNDPTVSILVEINSTKGLSSDVISMLDPRVKIRLYGGYDIKKINVYNFDNILEHITYTKTELFLIIREIEKIESSLKSNWSNYQKLICFYERLKTAIKYDPKYESKTSREIRTLRGFITKQTVCAGYSLMLKELCDRNGIECDYVTGHVKKNNQGGHAWNIVTINGRRYPVDLTWDSCALRRGQSVGSIYLGQNTEEFRESHIPGSWEKIQDYKNELSSIDLRFLKQISNEMNVGKTIYEVHDFTRKDGSNFAIAEIGVAKIEENMVFRYAYFSKDKQGNYTKPIIFYSTTSYKKLEEAYNFGVPIPYDYKRYIKDVLFSYENLSDSIKKGTWFIGGIQNKKKSKTTSKIEFYSSSKEIEKDEKLSEYLNYVSNQFKRSDGTCFLLQEMGNTKEGKLRRYDMVEQVVEDGRIVVKRNILYSERNLLNDSRESFVNEFLSRERVDRKTNECGGYLGYYDEHGIRKYDEDIKKEMEVNQNKSFTNDVLKLESEFPTFEEARNYAEEYYIDYDLENGISSLRIIETKTGKQLPKGLDFTKALWSNLWLSSAGTKWIMNESVSGITYAFNEQAEFLYNFIVSHLKSSCEKDGVIDTISLFDDAYYSGNKYGMEVISRLFRSDYQTMVINEYFKYLTGQKMDNKLPVTLYNEIYAANISRDNQSKITL